MSDCIFCESNLQRAPIRTFDNCYVLEDAYPVSKGHLLIIPKEHVLDWFSASKPLQLELLDALSEMKQYLEDKHQPDGYNIGMNCGNAAGQSIMHLHIHLIPRYQGDSQNPKGGVRGVIPSKQSY